MHKDKSLIPLPLLDYWHIITDLCDLHPCQLAHCQRG